MTDDERVEWSEVERRALGSLEMEAAPDPGLEDRIARELAARGAFAPLPLRSRGVPRLARSVAAAAAAALLFLAGTVVGRRLAPANPGAPADAEPRFAVFLLDEPPGGAAEEGKRVAEYKRWAASLPRGSVVTGEKLGDEARLLAPGLPADAPIGAAAAVPTPHPGDSADALRGYFVIRAPDLARAVEVARSCPHLKRGGRILVRPIVPV